jgi:hypothetical protein
MNIRGVSPLVAGGLGGIIGTLFMQKSMKLVPKLPEDLRPPPISEDPGEYMVKSAERMIGRPLPAKVHGTAAKGLHWTYGMFWPTVLGFATKKLAFDTLGKTILAGSALGAVVWGAGYAGWLPATGLTAKLRQERVSQAFSGLFSHVLYGIISALPIYAAGKLAPTPKISPWKRVFGLY